MKRRLQAAVSALLAGLLLNGCAPVPAEVGKTELMLMTSLPLRFGEATMEEQLRGGGEPAPAYRRLQQHFSITSLDDLEQLDARPVGVLLLAQPRALAPVELVALDRWLRAGGRALILADPALAWHSDYPLGDVRRPLFTSLLSPLLAHWGLELIMPTDAGRGSVDFELGDRAIQTVTVGEFASLGGGADPAARCEIMESARIASCAIGEGRALLLADTDLLDARFWQDDGLLPWWDDRRGNMQWIQATLEALQ